MKLTNAMEHAVRNHLNRLRDESAEGDERCWCSLCRSDMMAMTLSLITPRYATRRQAPGDVDPTVSAAISEAVNQARHQVSTFPKHLGRGAETTTGPVWVVNFPLEEGFRAVDEILRRHDGACDCWHCRCDMVAFALNRYPARYGVEHGGQTHLLEKERLQIRAEVSSYLDLAVRVVTAVPRHQLTPVAV